LRLKIFGTLAFLVVMGMLLAIGVKVLERRVQMTGDLPTPADINALGTAVVLTENAPPAGFDTVSFPRVDDHLTSLSGWRYVVTLDFEGVFSGTTRETTASARAEVSYNRLGSARRVVVSTSGQLLGREEAVNYEAVRLGPDAFLVEDGVCMSNAGQDAEIAADLSAGELIGGIDGAEATIQKAVINGAQVWRYGFAPDATNLPAVQLEEGGTLDVTGELWIAPEYNAIVRYYATLDVTNARIFGRQLPADGTITLRYDVYDIGTAFNISQPFGC